jgi:hypothetical protein
LNYSEWRDRDGEGLAQIEVADVVLLQRDALLHGTRLGDQFLAQSVQHLP